jgi:hypothetical protein
MKANTIMALKKVVKEMVEKEVAKQINIVIEEMRNPAVISEADAADHYTGNEPSNQQLAKDPVLNKILNETKGGISTGEEFEAYPTMGGGAIDSPEKFYEQKAVLETAATGAERTFSSDTPDFIKKAFSGHSAKVVKAIEKKHGIRS